MSESYTPPPAIDETLRLGVVSRDAEIIEHPSIQEAEERFAADAQREAAEGLPLYEISVHDRETIDRCTTPEADIITERVRFIETAKFFNNIFRKITVRDATVVIPRATPEDICPYPIVATDALFTGSQGLNSEAMVRKYFPVVWLHHEGRYSGIPKGRKSIGKAAQQQHALLDDLAPNNDFDTGTTLAVSASRGASILGAYRATAQRNNRKVLYGDFQVETFLDKPTNLEMLAILRGLPGEVLSLLGVTVERLSEDISNGNLERTAALLKTPDLHPINVGHELLWALALKNGEHGSYRRALPMESMGTHTINLKDRLSQKNSCIVTDKFRKGIRYILRPNLHHMDHLRDSEQKRTQDRLDHFYEQGREMDWNIEELMKNLDMDRIVKE